MITTIISTDYNPLMENSNYTKDNSTSPPPDFPSAIYWLCFMWCSCSRLGEYNYFYFKYLHTAFTSSSHEGMGVLRLCHKYALHKALHTAGKNKLHFIKSLWHFKYNAPQKRFTLHIPFIILTFCPENGLTRHHFHEILCYRHDFCC